jgi:hypothetical protein
MSQMNGFMSFWIRVIRPGDRVHELHPPVIRWKSPFMGERTRFMSPMKVGHQAEGLGHGVHRGGS